MMSFYKLEPEVAGGWGEDTEADTTVHPPVISKLHYEFDDWLGDGLVESFPAFVVTQALGLAIQQGAFSGFALGPVKVSRSPQFSDLNPDRDLPAFSWLQITGMAGVDDFGLSPEHLLVVSERALGILKSHNLDFCEIAEWR